MDVSDCGFRFCVYSGQEHFAQWLIRIVTDPNPPTRHMSFVQAAEVNITSLLFSSPAVKRVWTDNSNTDQEHNKEIFQSRGWPMNMFSQNISEKFVFILMSIQESFLQGQSRVHSGHAWGSSCDLSCTDTTAKFIGMLACSKKVEVYQWTCFPCISQKSSYSL